MLAALRRDVLSSKAFRIFSSFVISRHDATAAGAMAELRWAKSPIANLRQRKNMSLSRGCPFGRGSNERILKVVVIVCAPESRNGFVARFFCFFFTVSTYCLGFGGSCRGHLQA